MAIQPVRPGGYGPNQTPRASELAQIDQRLATRGLDSRGPDTISGVLSLAQDPLNPSFHPKLTIPAGHSVFIDAAGALLRSQNGGRIVCGAGDVPTYSVARTRTVRFSALEACRSDSTGGTAGNRLTVHAPSGGVTGAGYTDIWFPITKPHDGALLTSLKFWIFFATDPGTTVGFTVVLARIDSTVGGVAGAYPVNGIGGNTVTLGYNGGAAQSAAMANALTNNGIDISHYNHLAFLRTDLTHAVVTAVEVGYSQVDDERFPQ